MAGHPIRFGAKLVPQGTTIAALRAFWRLADESGFDHLWVYDHLAGVGNAATVAEPDPAVDLFDGWSLLAAMASETRTARLGAMVTANSLRHPAVLAKTATTVDHLSGGRLEFGIGTGWAEYEHRMLGIELGSPRQRIEKLDEALRILKALWSPEPFTDFAGEHYTLEKAVHAPKPVQRPHPPIWFGANAPQALARAVRHGDGFLGAGSSSTAAFAEQAGIIRRELEHQGREPAGFSIGKRVYLAVDDDPERARQQVLDGLRRIYGEMPGIADVPVFGTTEEVIRGLREVRDAGAELILLNPLGADVAAEREQMERLAADVVPQL